jgi:hypothetical protein
MKGCLQAFLEEKEGQRNGYYERDIGTRRNPTVFSNLGWAYNIVRSTT